MTDYSTVFVMKEHKEEVEDKEEYRGGFANGCEYFLANLGLAVGLGNLWRFPYVCYNNGGGTFLFPYLLMLLVVGLPVFFTELAIGQYAGVSPTKIFGRIAPGLQGLGYGMSLVPVMVTTYYTMVMAYALLFVFYGFAKTLPWSNCRNSFNSYFCWSPEDQDYCNTQDDVTLPQTFYNNSCMSIDDFCKEFDFQVNANHTMCQTSQRDTDSH